MIYFTATISSTTSWMSSFICVSISSVNFLSERILSDRDVCVVSNLSYNFCSNVAISDSSISVSYTHLDVYKRQGIEGIVFFQSCRNTNHMTNTITEVMLLDQIWENVSIRFWITDSCFTRFPIHNIVFNCPNAIVSDTPAINPCNAVAGILSLIHI